MDVKVKKTHPDAVLPKKGKVGDFCFDVVATSRKEKSPGVYQYGIGLAFEIVKGIGYDEYDVSIDVRPRSSIYKTGLVLCNAPGTVDYGYRGEVMVTFRHVDKTLPIYEVGDRIAQIKIGIAPIPNIVWADDLSETERGEGGHGSTGA